MQLLQLRMPNEYFRHVICLLTSSSIVATLLLSKHSAGYIFFIFISVLKKYIFQCSNILSLILLYFHSLMFHFQLYLLFFFILYILTYVSATF